MANPEEKIVQFPDTVSGSNIGALYARIAKTAAAVGAVVKDKKHAQGYEYISANAVMGHLVAAMADNGLAVIPRIVNRTIITETDGNQRWLIDYQFIIGDADGNTIVIDWVGEAPLKVVGAKGPYSDDKSLGKAHTYAHKYFLMKLFLISDIETDDLDENDPSKKAEQKAKPAGKNQKADDKKDPDKALGDKNAGDKWLADIRVLCTPFYGHDNHRNNSIALALQEGYIKRTMSVNEATAFMLRHCAMKPVSDGGLELSEHEMGEALGGTLGAYIKIEGNSFASAWDVLKRYDLWKTEQESLEANTPDPDEIPM